MLKYVTPKDKILIYREEGIDSAGIPYHNEISLYPGEICTVANQQGELIELFTMDNMWIKTKFDLFEGVKKETLYMTQQSPNIWKIIRRE